MCHTDDVASHSVHKVHDVSVVLLNLNDLEKVVSAGNSHSFIISLPSGVHST